MKITATTNDTATGATLSVTLGDETLNGTCDVAEIDAAIAELVALRAQMSPARKVEHTPGETQVYECDNLLWDTLPDPSRRGVMIAHYHGGLGWVTVRLSRAQLEDLVTDIQFSLADLARLPGFQNARALAMDNAD